MHERAERVAVLVSGGLDSAVLVGDFVRQGCEVFPLYVKCGLVWEELELVNLRRFLAGIAGPRLRELVALEMPVRDVYGSHWSLTGNGVPDEHSPDQAVYLPGRNLLLLLKGMLWCHLHHVSTLALGLLQGNPFSDATAEFLDSYASVVNRGIEGTVRIARPYAILKKADVIRRGQGMPLEWTLSCMRPIGGRHCGRCNKCAERQKGFQIAGVGDPTVYCEAASGGG